MFTPTYTVAGRDSKKTSVNKKLFDPVMDKSWDSEVGRLMDGAFAGYLSRNGVG